MPILHPLRLPLAALMLTACGGHSGEAISPPPAPPPALTTSPTAATVARPPARAALNLAVLDGARWRTEGDHDFQLSYRFRGNRYTTSGYPVWEESGQVTLLEVDGKRLHLSFGQRVFDGHEDGETMLRWLVLADDSNSFEMDGMVFHKDTHAAVVAGVAIEPAVEAAQPL
jgi:hypothetical protein